MKTEKMINKHFIMKGFSQLLNILNFSYNIHYFYLDCDAI